MRGGTRNERRWAVVPIKAFNQAKSRLKPSLGVSKRFAIAHYCAHHVLSILKSSQLFEEVVVVTNAEEVATALQVYSVVVSFDEPSEDLATTLNRVAGQLRDEGVTCVVMLMSDLPLLSAKVLNEVCRLLNRWDCVVAPDRREHGTNLLATRRIQATPIFFGAVRSYELHCRGFERAGLSFETFRSIETGLDLDLPQDYLTYLRQGNTAG